jgi:nucleoside-triphosphatase
MQYNILVTGPPASGKSTLIQDLIKSKKVFGILTPEVRKDGERWGFKVIDIKTGKEGILASIEIRPHMVSKYGVDVAELDRIALPAIEAGIKTKDSTIVVDEIGQMEMHSEKFKKVVLKALDTKRVLATISMKSHDPFIENIKSRSDVKLIYLTRVNYERLEKEIKEEL